MLRPVNRMLLVDLAEEESVNTPQQSFYLPDDVAVSKEYEVVTLLDAADDSKFIKLVNKNVKLVVEGHMLREVNIAEKSCHVVQDNYVLGIVSE